MQNMKQIIVWATLLYPVQNIPILCPGFPLPPTEAACVCVKERDVGYHPTHRRVAFYSMQMI